MFIQSGKLPINLIHVLYFQMIGLLIEYGSISTAVRHIPIGIRISSTPIQLIGITPVSYTHLDVYKRQFIHILDLQDDALYIPLKAKVKKVIQFISKTPLSFKQEKDGIFIKLPQVPDDIDYVIELVIKQ